MRIETRTLRAAWVGLTLGLITLGVFSQALTHSFLVYDDQQYVTENAHVRAGLSWQGAVWAFGKHADNWHPLTWLSHMADCQFYGLKAWGHHLTSVLLHAANTLLLFVALKRMTGTLWRSAAVAGLFAWHPLHVESVAWVAERKDVLSAFFFMLTLLAYVRYAEAQGRNPESRRPKAQGQNSSFIIHHSSFWYWLALALFALALMSKPMVVTLPFVLLLLDYWPLRRCQPSTLDPQPSTHPLLPVLVEKLPFFVLAAISCVLTLSAQHSAMVSTAGLRVSQRFEHAPIAYAHYLGALFVPRHMAVYYPYTKGVATGEIVFDLLLLVVVTVLVLRLLVRRPYLAVGWFWFLGMLVPVLGLVQVGEQAWADRYTYLPSIGLFIAVVWGVGELADRAPAGRALLPWLAGAVGLGLLGGTCVQLRYWKDTRSLFEHAARVTRKNPLAATLLGSLLAKEGKLDEAIEYYRAVLSYAPGFPEAHFYLGHAFEEQGKLDDAIAEYQKALRFKPMQEETRLSLGAVLARRGMSKQAADQYLAALQLNPESAIAHNNLAKLFHAQGRLDDAILHYSAALKCDPTLAQAYNNLGVLLLQKGRTADGIAQLRESLRLKPGNPETELNLAQALVEQEQWRAAAELFAKCVTSATSDPNVHCGYALALARLHKTREAMTHYATALLLRPDFPAALDGLAWILSTDPDPTIRNGEQAFAMAERACELTGRKDAEKLKTLAAACAETGRFSQAVFDAQAARDLAVQKGQKALAEDCGRMVERFKASQPERAEK